MKILAAAIAMTALAACDAHKTQTDTPAAFDFLDAPNLDAAYFPVSSSSGFPGIYSDYGFLQADAEMCGWQIPDKIRDFIEQDQRTFPAEQQSRLIKMIQQSRSFGKELYADRLKDNGIAAVCAREKSLFNYWLAAFPQNATDYVFKAVGEWEAVRVVCWIGGTALSPIFEKARKMGVSLDDLDRGKDRLNYWRDHAQTAMGAPPLGSKIKPDAYKAGRTCAGAVPTYDILNKEYWRFVRTPEKKKP